MEKTRQALKDRYRTGMYPTEADFADVFDSYVHKSDTVDVSKVNSQTVDGTTITLQTMLNEKAESATVSDIGTRLTALETRTGDLADIQTLQQNMAELTSRVNTVETQATRTFSYRGSVDVATINALDTTELVNGDVYNITDTGSIGDLSVSAGDSVCWTGTEWNVLSYTDYTDIYERIERKVDLTLLGYPSFSSSQSYEPGDIVIVQGYIVRFIEPHQPGQWNPNETEDVTIRELLQALDTSTLFTLLTQVQTAQQQQALTIAQAQTTIGQHTTTLGTHEDRIKNLEDHQGEVDLTQVYQRINQVDGKADSAVSTASEAVNTANSAATTANSIAQTAAAAQTAATSATQTANTASTLATSLSSSVSTLTTSVEGLRESVNSCVINGGGVESARALSLAEYDELSTKSDTTFYILTAD